MKNDLVSRIYSLFENILRVPGDKLSEQTRRGDVEEWDSLGHILLIEALSKEFEVKISPEQALEMETIQDIIQMVTKLKKSLL
ncbi:MAG: acyl carrier protein [Calditrichaeota bacterium]|nr:acyl carrier protein [Calditrichota bacterium]